MNTRTRFRTAAVLASTLTLALTACTTSDNSTRPKGQESESRNTAPESEQTPAPDHTTAPDNVGGGGRVLAQVTGRDSIVLTITRVERSASGKSVTVSATLKNTGTKGFFGISAYGGTDASIKGRMHSLAGATLTDTANSLRYYVLRDTAGGCLCSTALRALDPGETVPVFAQFPAPPDTVRSVDFQLPTFPNATIPLGAAE